MSDAEKKLMELRDAIIDGDSEKAKEITEELVRDGIDPLRIIKEVVGPASKIVGEKFESAEIFLPDLIMAGEALKAVVDVVSSSIPEGQSAKKGKILIATVKGDLHDIGKNIVSSLLAASGFEVYDLGIDVDAQEIIQKAEEVQADVIGLSALLTTTLEQQREVINLLKELGLRDKYIVVIGGAPVTKEWCEEIGADGWSTDAIEAVKLIEELMEKKKKR